MGFSIGQIDLGLNINPQTFNRQLAGMARSAQATAVNAFKPVGRIIGAALAGGAIVKFTKDCLELGSDLTEVQNVVDTTFSHMSGKVNEFAKEALTSFGLSEKVTKQYMGTLGAMSKSMGFSTSESYDMAKAVTALTGDVASFYNLSSDEAFNKLKSIWTGETETLKSIGVLLTQTNLDQYALNNGFGKTTAKMTEQEKVMLRYRYTMSALSDASGDFAKTQESWANQTRILSLQFDSLKTTLGQGFINLFTPVLQVINSIIAKMSVLAGRFKEFTELLMGNRNGSSTVGSIVSDSADAVSGLNDVTDAAKEASKAAGLLKIDNLNNLTSTTASSASSGSTGSVSGIGAEAEQTEGALDEVDARMASIVEKADKLIERLKTIGNDFKSGNFFKAGSDTSALVTDMFNMYSNAVDDIAWHDIGSKMADCLNGAITPDLFSAAARTITSSLNASINASLGFGSTFDFKNLGVSIATGVNTFFETFDFAGLADTVNVWVNGIKTTLTEAVKKVKWSDVFNGIGEFICNLDIGTIEVVLGAIFIKKILSLNIAGTALSWVSKRLGQKLAASIGASIGADAGLGTAIVAGIKQSVASLGGVGGLLTTDLAAIFGAGTAMEIGVTIGAGIIGGIAAAIGGWNLGQFLYEKLSGTEIDMSWTEQFSYVLKAPFEDFNSFIDGLTMTLTDFENNPVLTTLADALAGPFVTGAAYVHKHKDDISADLELLKDDFGKFKEKVGEKWDGIERWFNEDIKPWFTKEKWKTEWENVKTASSDGWTDFKKWWGESGVSKWFNDDVKPWFTKEKWKSAMQGIKESFKETFKEAANLAIEKMNNLGDKLNEKMHVKWDAVTVAGKEIIPAMDFQIFTLPKIPALAQGGYVGPNQPQLAMIGDNRSEGEIVSPESKLVEMARMAASMSDNKEELQLLKEIIAILKAILDKPGISDSDIGRAAKKYSQEYYKRTGNPAYY